MNADMLKGKMREMALTQKATAESIGISLSRFNAKLNGADGAEFSLGEIRSLRGLLHLSPEQVNQIFLA